VKEITEYHKAGKSGYNNQCKPCRKETKHRSYLKNKEKCLEYSRKYKELYPEKNKINARLRRERDPDCDKRYYNENKERLNELNKRYYQENKARCYELHKKWKQENPEKVKQLDKKYRENNKEKIREQQNKRNRENPQHRIKQALRKRVGGLVRKGYKSASTLELLGCEYQDFLNHLESKFDDKMTWDNYGSYWHVDHIRPCASFNLLDPEEQKICFHYTNMQPLEAIENIRKGDKWDGDV
jgi:hypothetical protein